jgi:Ca2+-binding RTX toxin-like protein
VDTVDYVGQAAGLQVDLGEGFATAFDRFDRLAEIEVVRGSNFADDLLGDAFGNQFFGNGGNDEIDGGQGNDVLSGGAGADVFDFDARVASKFFPATDSGFDRVTDFERGEGDLIDLRTHKAATDFADLRAEASQFGTDTHLRVGVDTIVLEDVTLAELSASMFLF